MQAIRIHSTLSAPLLLTSKPVGGFQSWDSTHFLGNQLLPRVLHTPRKFLLPERNLVYASALRGILSGLGRTVEKLISSSEASMASASNLASPTPVPTLPDLPSWDALNDIIKSVSAEPEMRLAHTKERLFGSTEEPRIVFYRDNSSWCPYCQRVWLQLEEKQIPHRVEKINMRCYGPKPAWYTQMVPSGLLPAVKIDGKLITESLDIMLAIEREFPEYKPLLPPPGSPDFRAVDGLLRLEREVMGAWLHWLTRPFGSQSSFEAAMNKMEAALIKRGGPFLLGKEFSMVDAVYAPFLERAAASIPYYKGFVFRGTGRWPAVDAWFDALDAKPMYLATKSDDFTHTHILEPQVGPCKSIPEGAAYRTMVEGRDGGWDLPLKPEVTAWGVESGDGEGGVREEAARALAGNHEAIVGFALRGVKDGERYREAVSGGFRYVAHAILKGTDEAGPVPSGMPEQVAVAAAYLRDRVGVPRDVTYPAARQLRAHLQYLIRGMGSNL